MSTMQEMIAQDLSEVNIVFIHSALDDAELSPAAFRVYCHLARRASGKRASWPSAETMVKVCRLNRKTVWRALGELEERGMILREKREGRSTMCRLTTPSQWCKESPTSRGLKRDNPKEAPGLDSGHHLSQKEPHHLSQTEPHEGYPRKGIQEGVPPGMLPTAEADADLVPSDPRGGSEEKELGETEEAKPRPRNELFDALAVIDGCDLGGRITRTEAGRVAKALKLIREASPEVTPDEIRQRAAQWARIFPYATCTSTALAGRWSACQSPAKKALDMSVAHPLAHPPVEEWRLVARDLGLGGRISADTRWPDVSHEHRRQIIAAVNNHKPH